MNRRSSSVVAVAATAGVAIIAFAVPAAASDASIAKTLLITKADAGPGFTAIPGPATDPNAYTKLSTCVGKPSPKRKVTTVDGQQLTNTATGDVILSSVDIVKTSAQYKADVKLYKNPKFTDCLKQLVQGQVPPGATVAYVNTSSAPLLKPHFGSTFIGAVDIQIQLANGKFTHILDVAIGKGRAEITAQLQSGSGTTNVSELTAPLDKLNKRLKKAKL